MDGLIWLSTARYTVGLVVADDRVVDAPPIARRWAMGADARQVWRDAARRGARLVWLPGDGRTVAGSVDQGVRVGPRSGVPGSVSQG